MCWAGGQAAGAGIGYDRPQSDRVVALSSPAVGMRRRLRVAGFSIVDMTTDYKRLFERAPDAILVVDGDGQYVDANPAACELTGYTRDEILQMRVGGLTVPSDRGYSVKRFDLLRKVGQLRADRILLRKNGTTAHIEAHAVSLGDGRFLTIVRDISERVASREQLQRSVDAYSTLVELCHAAVISAGVEGRIQSWNPAAEDLFGYSKREAMGLPVVRLIPERLRDVHTEGFRRQAEGARSAAFTRTLYGEGLRKDGTEVAVEVSVGVGWREEERVFTAVIRDVTRQRETVEQLNDALQRLQFHMERTPLAYIVWDAEFGVVEWNPAAERMFGYTKAEAVGRHAYDLIVPPDAVPAVDAIWSDLLSGDTSSHSINANRRKDGSKLTCEWFNTPLRDSAGRVRGVASMAMDTSEREALESRVRDAQKLESLGVLAGGIAHDFNSSLMVILGNAALLRSTKGLSSRALEYVEMIEEAGSRADELIKHLLAYARTGRHNPQPTDLNGVIQSVMKLVRSSMGKRHPLELQLADRLPTVVADHSQVEQVILNLCLNAKEAMAGGGTITLATRATDLNVADAARCVPYDASPGRYVEMTVTDDGEGMDEATISRMFDPFFTTKADGHGLGMAAVLGILRQHNAAARVDSQRGVGTGFHVFFPVRPSEKAPPQPQRRGKRRSSSRTGAAARSPSRKKT